MHGWAVHAFKFIIITRAGKSLLWPVYIVYTEFLLCGLLGKSASNILHLTSAAQT